MHCYGEYSGEHQFLPYFDLIWILEDEMYWALSPMFAIWKGMCMKEALLFDFANNTNAPCGLCNLDSDGHLHYL